jgi:hypothetical protein
LAQRFGLNYGNKSKKGANIAITEAFQALVRTIESESYREILSKQSNFATEMCANRAVMSTQFPEGEARIACDGARDFVKAVAVDCAAVQDLSNPQDFDEAVEIIKTTAKRLIGLGSNPMLPKELTMFANVMRSLATKEIAEHARDSLKIAHAKSLSRMNTGTLQPTNILMLLAMPLNESSISTNTECRKIRQSIRSSDMRDYFALFDEPATRFIDIISAFNRHHPNILHFAGHGCATGIALLDHDNNTKPLDAEMLIDLIRVSGVQLTLVVLNACESAGIGEKVIEVCPFVIATSSELDDRAALIFAEAL